MSFMRVASIALCISALTACQWPTAPVDDFSMLPDNVFTASVRKHVRTGSGPIDMAKFEQDFMATFANEDVEAVTKTFQASGGNCALAKEGSQELITCKILFKWRTTNEFPKWTNGTAWLGLMYRITAQDTRVDGVKVRVHYDAPLN